MKLKHLSCFVLSLTIAVILYSCGAQKPSVVAADNAFNNEKYFAAADLYKKAITTVRKKEDKAYVTYKVAECYRLINNYKQSVVWYDKAIKAGYTGADAYIKLAEAQKTLEKFDDAIETYQLYLEKKPNDSVGLKGIEMSKLALKWKEKANAFDVFNEVTINTKDFDYAPAFYGKGIIFASNRGTPKGKDIYDRTGKSYENIYAAVQTGKNKWTKPEQLNKNINTAYNEGVASFDNENRILYFTQCNGAKGKETGCKIYETTNEGANWTEPKPIDIPNPDSAIIAHPSVSADGKRLFFVSDMKGGMGGKDIWISEKQGNSWGVPVNAGPKINTPGDEQFPFIHPSGTLYFASNGHMGIGGLDIFFCDWEEGDWADAVSLKSPINSTGDDFGLILDENKELGYFTSNRVGGRGEDDIYSAIAIPLVFTAYGKTINNQTQKVLPQTKVTIVGSDGSTQTATSDAQGAYKFTLKKDVNYELKASKYRFFGDAGEASTYGFKESKDFEINFKLNPIPLKEIVLKGILYDLNSADLRPESISILDSLIKTMNDNPTFVIEIASHTDSRADSNYNYQLSQRRAQSVVNFMVKNGVDSARLVPKGYGESRLLNECKDGVECTEDQHQQNRRTSFSVIAENYVPKEQKIPESGKPKPGPKPGARPVVPAGTRPAGTIIQQQPGTTQPAGTAPAGTQPVVRPPGTPIPAGARPAGTLIQQQPKPAGTQPNTTTPANTQPKTNTGTTPATQPAPTKPKQP